MDQKDIVILSAPGCRRSRKLIEYLESRHIPFTRIELNSSQGQALMEQYNLRASPGILVNEVSINPFDLLVQPVCRVDEVKAEEIFAELQKKSKQKK
jgi:arsenate reductase-like glutaredoxin family protein